MELTKEKLTETITMDDLSNSEKIMYLFLLFNTDINGTTKLTNRSLSESLGIAEITVNKNLESLEKNGIITRGFEINRNVPGCIERTIEILK